MAAVVVEGAGAGGKSSWRGVRNWRGPPSAHSHMCFECLRWCYDVISSQRQAAAPAVFEFSHSYSCTRRTHTLGIELYWTDSPIGILNERPCARGEGVS